MIEIWRSRIPRNVSSVRVDIDAPISVPCELRFARRLSLAGEIARIATELRRWAGAKATPRRRIRGAVESLASFGRGMRWHGAGGGVACPGGNPWLSVPVDRDGYTYRLDASIPVSVEVSFSRAARPVAAAYANSVGYIAHQGTSGAGVTSLTTADLAVSGTNRAIGVIVGSSTGSGTQQVTAAKFGGAGGANMAAVGAEASSGLGWKIRAYSHVNPPTSGDRTVHVEWDTTVAAAFVSAIAVDNVDQSTPVNASSIWSASSAGPTIGTTHTTVAGELCFDGCIDVASDTPDVGIGVGAGQTTRMSADQSGVFFVTSTKPAVSASTAVQFSTVDMYETSYGMAAVGFAFRESSGGSAPIGVTSITDVVARRTSADVKISYSASDHTGFHYRIDGGAVVDVGMDDEPSISDLSPGTEYSLEARAYNDTGVGAWSDPYVFSTAATLRNPGAIDVQFNGWTATVDVDLSP